MIEALTHEQKSSVKKSYLNILGLFLENEKIESRYLRCLLKWGFQLGMHPEDLHHTGEKFTFTELDKVERLESIYHLVYMIYLDEVVEDLELEVASIYAIKLGFHKDTVGELFRSIATAPYDEDEPRNVRQEVLDFLKVYNS